MKIKNITNFQSMKWHEINNEAVKIHPKLFSLLNYSDIISDKFDFEKIDEYYDSLIIPMTESYRTEVEIMMDEYRTSLIEDSILLFESAGFNTLIGSEVENIGAYDKNNFIPRPEIYDLYNAINDLHEFHSFIPFWKRNISVNDGYRTYTLRSSESAKAYIKDARERFSHIGSTDKNKNIIDAVHAIDAMPNFFVKEENSPNYNSMTTLAKAVQRHKVLYALKEQLQNKTTDEQVMYISKVDLNGNITFRGEEL